MTRTIIRTFFPLAAFLASCSPSVAGDTPKPMAAETKGTLTVTPLATLDAPWAIAVLPRGGVLVTEKAGKLKLIDGSIKEVAGVPTVDFGGQGGLGDVVLGPDYAKTGMIYLSWAEAGENDTRGAAIGRAKLVLGDSPRLEGLEVIWRQSPKVTGRGHYSHRIAFSPDGKLMFVASGERQKMDPAQDLSVNLGKVLRLLPDGTPAPGNPFAEKGGVSIQICPMATVTFWGWPSIRKAGCGTLSMAPPEAMNSIWSNPARTMAGRLCPKAITMMAATFRRTAPVQN